MTETVGQKLWKALFSVNAAIPADERTHVLKPECERNLDCYVKAIHQCHKYAFPSCVEILG